MISELLNKFLTAREAYREKAERFFRSIAEKRWYRLSALIVSLVLLARIIDPSVGSVMPSPLARMPNWIFYLGLVALVPLLAQAFSLQRENNLKRYDPEAPEIRKMTKRWALVGWIASGFVALYTISILVFIEHLENLPVWGITTPLILAIFVAVAGFQRAGHIRSGLWSPPEWMPPMGSTNSNENHKDITD